MFKLEMTTGNAAFRMPDSDEPDPREVARILRETADIVDEAHGILAYEGVLMDGNVQRVGTWEYNPEGN